MGYYTSMSGEIEINPPLRAEEVDPDHLEFYSRAGNGVLAISESEAGVHYAVIPYDGDSVKAYHIEEDLQYLVDKYGKGRTFGGYIYGEGEDNEDMWRLVVRDGKAVKLKPRIVWDE